MDECGAGGGNGFEDEDDDDGWSAIAQYEWGEGERGGYEDSERSGGEDRAAGGYGPVMGGARGSTEARMGRVVRARGRRRRGRGAGQRGGGDGGRREGGAAGGTAVVEGKEGRFAWQRRLGE